MQASILTLLVFMAGGADAERQFTEAEAKLKACTSLSGALVGHGRANYRADFLLLKPGYVRKVDGQVNIYSDGKVQVNHIVGEKAFFKRQLGRDDRPDAISCLDGFIGHATGSALPYYVKSTTYRTQKVDGRMCAAKAMVFESFGRDDRMVFYVDSATKLPVGWDQVFGGTKMHYRLRGLKLNPKLSPADFAWNQPPGLQDRTPDPWVGRYADPSAVSPVAMQVEKKGDKYVLSGFRHGPTKERLEGAFDPATLTISGVFHYDPEGTSKFSGLWVAEKEHFELTDEQGDARVTYTLKRVRLRRR